MQSHYRTQDDYEQLRQILMQKIAELKESKDISRISVYFRDLRSGSRFGIQEFETYNGASLLKLPVMIAILRIADVEPEFLDKHVLSPSQFSDRQNAEKMSETIQPNTTYTIRELLEKMIVYSDNLSAFMLADEITATQQPIKSNVFLDLGVMDLMSGKIDQVSMQLYANLFVVLYNSRYLSNEMSQFALELLSRSTYKDALVSGVPEGTRVAHKFGFNFDAKRASELHDCGIVYHSVTPYVLCVMTSGTRGTNDQAAIAEISKTVFSAVESLHMTLDPV